MRLYIVRHAKAERESPTGRDEHRQLAEKGVRQARWLAEQIAGSVPPDRILSSTAVRAWDTALALADRLGIDPEGVEALGLGSSAGIVMDLIGGLQGEGAAAIVGHNPTLSEVTGMLLRGAGAARSLELRTGQAALVEFHPGARGPGDAKLIGLLRMPADPGD